jgi:hypothetical protein
VSAGRAQDVANLKEVMRLIEKALPKSHPAIRKLEEATMLIECEEAGPGSELLETFFIEPSKMEDLMHSIGDWMRGVKDWTEIEVLFRQIERTAGAQGVYLPPP